jgi:hypothetical protein
MSCRSFFLGIDAPWRSLEIAAMSLIDLIEPGRSYPVWSPDRAFTAAAALLQALEDEKG